MKRRPTSLLLLALALAGCVATWAPRTLRPEIVLQWPYQPNPAKLTYLHSLTGFAAGRSAGTALRAAVYGREQAERNAFVLPVAVATAADGRIAVADLGRQCVHLYLPVEQRYLRLVGSDRERLASPVAVAFDDRARLYVSDSRGKVFAFGVGGELRFTLAAAGAEALQRPTGLAWSPGRRLLYVADTLAHRVHAFDGDGRHHSSFGGRGDGEGRLNFPTHLFWAASGELYVTDALNFRVAIFDEEGRPRGAFGHHGDGSGDLAMPKGLAVDGDGVVYVADALFDNLQLFDREGRFLMTLGKRGADYGDFWLPAGVFISPQGELYVCDTYNRRVQVFRITERYVPASPS
jgi:sugar lactone lactonase YvrE